MTKLTTAVKKVAFEPVRTEKQVTGTFEMTTQIAHYLQEQVDFISERAISQLGTISNWANIAAFQKHASYDQLFGNEYGLANDSNQKLLKYCAQSVAGDPESLVQIRANGSVWARDEGDMTISSELSDTDQNKIQVNAMAMDAITNASERYNKCIDDITLLNQHFGLEPTTSRKERYELYVTKELDSKRRRQEATMRSEAKYAQNNDKKVIVMKMHKVAQATAHLV